MNGSFVNRCLALDKANRAVFVRLLPAARIGDRSHEWVERYEIRNAAHTLSGGAEQQVKLVALPRFEPVVVPAVKLSGLLTRQHREEEARRYERQRLREIDERRWTRFRERADDWEERTKLLAFTAELQRRLETKGDTRWAIAN